MKGLVAGALRAALAAAALAFLGLPAAAQAVVQDLPLASGGTERVLFVGPASPRAILVMFIGGDGIVEIDQNGTLGRGRNNFLMRTQSLWLAQGFAVLVARPAVALVGAAAHPGLCRRHRPRHRLCPHPRQRPGLAGRHQHGFDRRRQRRRAPPRQSRGRGADLVGRGANRTANETVFDSDLGAIAVPALVVANRGDTCPSAGAGFRAANPRRAHPLAAQGHRLLREPPESVRRPARRCRRTAISGIEGDVVQRIVGLDPRRRRPLIQAFDLRTLLPIVRALASGGVHSSVGRAADS